MIAALLALLIASPDAWARKVPVELAAPSPVTPAPIGAPKPHPDAPAWERAAHAEMLRSIQALRLPDAPPPYLYAYDVLDGSITEAFASDGALVYAQAEPYRNLRAEVRVGDPKVDSSNFMAFGEPDGVVSRVLPQTDDVLALRREIWLATDSAYKAAVQQFSRKMAARQDDPTPHPPDRSPSAPTRAAPVPPTPGSAADVLAGLVSRLSAVASEDPRLEVAEAIARDWQGRRMVLTSEGTNLHMATGYVVLRVEGTARLADGSVLTDARAWVARTVGQLPDIAEMERETREMAEWLGALTTAPVEDDYLGPVLFEPAAATELFSQLLPSELVGTPPVEEDTDSAFRMSRSPIARIGRRLLPLGWSVVDDAPGHAQALGAYAWDHEGVGPRTVELVRDGVVRDVLMSRIPSKDRGESTGHGRAIGGERRIAIPAVVVVTPTRVSPMRRLERMGLRLAAQTGRDYVLVVRRLTPPALAQSQITFSGEGPPAGLTPPYEVYRLHRDGRRVPVRSLAFSGVDRRVLRDVAAAGPGEGFVDLLDGAPGTGRWHIGPTGGIPVTWSTPSVLITEMELVGNPGGEPRVIPPVGAPQP